MESIAKHVRYLTEVLFSCERGTITLGCFRKLLMCGGTHRSLHKHLRHSRNQCEHVEVASRAATVKVESLLCVRRYSVLQFCQHNVNGKHADTCKYLLRCKGQVKNKEKYGAAHTR